MRYIDRRTFLDSLYIASLACFPLIKKINKLGSFFLKTNIQNAVISDGIKMAETPAFIFDMHCHPNLKNYLWGKKLWRHHHSKKGDNIINMQVDFNRLLKGNVQGFLAAHYLPERGMIEQAKNLRKLFPLLKSVAPVFASKIEIGNKANFRQLLTMMDEFEEQLDITNKKLGSKKPGKDVIRIARSYQEFEENLNEGIISAIHSIEGSHSIGRDMKPDDYIVHVERLFERGVCLITLAHFFQNDLAFPVEGIPPAMKKRLGISWHYHEEYDNKPLTDIGRLVVRKMLELGMLVDMTHLAPKARAEIFDINSNEGFKRPIMFSHTGVEHLFAGPHEFNGYRYMGVTEEEIKQIGECDGVIGIIFMNYWLVGCDTHTTGCSQKNYKDGINYVISTIKYIHQVTGTYENIALGSDFDGFADAPDDLRDPGYFPDLIDEIRKAIHISNIELDMITHGNAMRVLKKGWAKKKGAT